MWLFNLRKRRGGNAIEFALTFPVFFFLVAGIVDFSWLMFYRVVLNSAVFDGCRLGAVLDPGTDGDDMADIQSQAQERIADGLSVVGYDSTSVDWAEWAGQPTFEVSPMGQSTSVETDVLVCEAQMPWQPIFGLLSARDLTALATVRMEFQRGIGES